MAELLSLEKVFQQLKDAQESVSQEQQEQRQESSARATQGHRGITEATFVSYLGLPSSKSRAGELFFRSFCNLSTFSGQPEMPSDREVPRTLTVRDFIIPLAMYCRHEKHNMSVDVNPLQAVYESFVETSTAGPVDFTTTTRHAGAVEESLRDLTQEINYEWNPEDDTNMHTGPGVKAQDLVEILDALFWLIQSIVEDRKIENQQSKLPHLTEEPRRQATLMVEHIISYTKSAVSSRSPLALTAELIDFDMFFRYISRNAPYLFEVLSQYFYGLFLIGDTFKRSEAGSVHVMTLPGISPVPVLESSSNILTPETIALVSWFLPLQKMTPTLTKLYAGSEHGFSMNQFEVHVCKYPAPTLFLLLAEQQMLNTSTTAFTNDFLHQHSISSNSPPTAIPDGVPSSNVESTGLQRFSSTTHKQRLVLGAFVTESWRVSKTGWGNDSFTVFELSPCFEVFPAKKSLPAPAWSVPKQTSSGASGVITSATAAENHSRRRFVHFQKSTGVGFGGEDAESCILYVDDNLQYGRYQQDLVGGNVYAAAGGPRQSGFKINFEVVECEVWGLGGPDAKARQRKEWAFEQREANRRASVHLRSKDSEQEIDRDLLVS
ncbi:Restriction of telomere capping protein 5 [Dissophora globulifera]|nr:Restriction of telomere capping protein 5 [Dissophora globulifera]